ncbi:MAG: GNAT family N-acetyltransferase [Deltaproteobacteria bacterium]|nr:GNAT family N-acetyltransferase [Deltaproteobacteria bacterium]
MDRSEPRRAAAGGFSERDFYLAEFRGRTLALALAFEEEELDAAGSAVLDEVLSALEANQTRVILLCADSRLLSRLVPAAPLHASGQGWQGALWRVSRRSLRMGFLVERGSDLAAVCREVVLELGLAKLVWIDGEGGLERSDGSRLSLVALEELESLTAVPGGSAHLGPERSKLLEEIRAMVEGGLPSASLCDSQGLADELFTYTGSGTFFSLRRYTEVRRLVLDEFDAANDLIRRGVEEGYLVSRSDTQIELILSNAFGVFVEGRYLAGIGALLPHPGARTGEIASLYTLTRFLGEGIGGHLVRFAVECSRERGYDAVFACTTSERVAAFFGREGFERVSPDLLPQEKWSDYAPERRSQVLCLRRKID